MSENKPFKLNLGALKNKSSEEKTEEILNLENIQEGEDKPIINKVHSLDLSEMKNKKENTKKEIKENKINIVEDQKEEIQEEKELFSNYESEFKKEKETILQKIHKFKKFIKPKTRIGFIAMLIGITFSGIASLFVISPEIHNLNNYEANLLKIKEKIECQINKKECLKKEELKKKKIEEEKNKIKQQQEQKKIKQQNKIKQQQEINKKYKRLKDFYLSKEKK